MKKNEDMEIKGVHKGVHSQPTLDVTISPHLSPKAWPTRLHQGGTNPV